MNTKILTQVFCPKVNSIKPISNSNPLLLFSAGYTINSATRINPIKTIIDGCRGSLKAKALP